jgi:peptidyl-prolyl cis-trans isomerase A (cyclophilin A)
MKNLIIIILLALLNFEAYPQKVKIHTSMGEITIKLEGDKAPKTVNNFIKYVQEGFYKGGSFFRTVREDNQENNPIKIEVIQAGCHPWKQNFLFDPIPLERTNKTGLKHKNGTISMARSTPNSAQDSFFICIEDQPELDFGGKRNPDGQGFAAFGQVIAGMEVVMKINNASAEGQALVPPILIENMVVIE